MRWMTWWAVYGRPCLEHDGGLRPAARARRQGGSPCVFSSSTSLFGHSVAVYPYTLAALTQCGVLNPVSGSRVTLKALYDWWRE
jgi:hypothetical protein